MSTKNFEGLSAVTTYEVNVLELEQSLQELRQVRKNEPTDELMKLCFETLDRVIPCLGLYQNVISAIKEDLHKGIYSERYTTENKVDENKPIALGRVPFFTIIKRINEEKDEEAGVLINRIKGLEKNLKLKEEHYQSLKKELRSAEEKLRSQERMLTDMTNEHKKKDKEMKKLVIEHNKTIRSSEREKNGLTDTIKDLQENISDLNQEKMELKVFQSGWEAIDQRFNEVRLTQNMKGDAPSVKSRAGFGDERHRHLKSILDIQKIEEQLLDLRNMIITNYDSALESGQHDPGLSTPFSKAKNDEMYDAHAERETKRLSRIQQQFVLNIKDIEEELNELRDQREKLKSKFNELQPSMDEFHAKQEQDNRGLETSVDPTDLDFVKIMGGKSSNPFIPHENILNKYSFVLFTSCNLGKTFYEVRDVKFCESCEAKTVICPHKMFSGSKVFPLPHNCTHVKVVCPELTLRKAEVKQQAIQREELRAAVMKDAKFPSLWEDYNSRSGIYHKQKIDLPLKDAVSIIHQFLAYLIWQDEYEVEASSIPILDIFYSFLKSRYLTDTVAYFSAFNLIRAFDNFEASDRLVRLFSCCLSGSMDMASLRYVLLVGDYIDRIEWSSTDDFVPFIQILYPALTEDELEYFKMEYISFSENSISKAILFQYILNLVLMNKEPWIKEMQSHLYKCPARYTGYFSDVELSEAVDSISPLASDRLRSLLFSQSEARRHAGEGRIPLLNAAQISAYLSASQLSPKVRDDVSKFARDLKGRRKEKRSVVKEDDFSSVVKYATIKALGAKLARNFRIKKMFQGTE